jgi:hypothetical protein
MFAWILKTKLVIFGSSAETVRVAAIWARGGGGQLADGFDQVAHAIIAQRRAEIDRREVALAEGCHVERLHPAFCQHHLVAPFADGVRQQRVEDRVLGPAHGLVGRVGLVVADEAPMKVIGADELAPAPDRPGHGGGV